MDDTKSDRMPVYEIGYLLISSVPEDKVPHETGTLKKIITDACAAVMAEEMPHRERLAYTMRTKTVSGAYDSFQEAYFGWIKFELAAGKIEAVKKAFERHPSVLRMLLLSTVSENTYLGKRASAIAASFGAKSESDARPDRPDRTVERVEAKKEAIPPASLEELDKSIDEMVKEAI